MKKKQIWIIILVVIAGLLVWWLFFTGNEATAPTDEQANSEITEPLPGDDPNQEIPEGSATNQLPANGDALAVLAQQAGAYVTVDNYVLSKAGYIVIHSVNSDGSAGPIIGQSGLLSAGRGQDLEINATIQAGRSYVAMLHYDNGDKKFDANQDAAALDEGKPIMITFKVQ